jgi:hypothetical protein
MPLKSWYLTSSFTSQEAYESFDKLIRPLHHPSNNSYDWQPEVEPGMGEDFAGNFDFAINPPGISWTLQKLSDVATQTGTLAEWDASRSTDVTFITVCSILRAAESH